VISQDYVRCQGNDRRKKSFGRRHADIVLPANFNKTDSLFHSGPFTIDDQRKRILFHGLPVQLTKKEYYLFALLICNSGSTLSAADIADVLWPGSPQSFTEIKRCEVKQFVYTLRQKLRRHTGTGCWIETNRGFGYMFTDLTI
jgi:DNA-binding response OmpR family regulator